MTDLGQRRYAWLLAGALVLGACGSSDDEVSTTEAVAEDASGTDTTDDTSDTTEAPEVEQDEGESASGADSEFCRLTAEQDDMAEVFAAFDDPEAFEEFARSSTELIDDARRAVPDEIADDFAVLADAQVALFELAADNDYDFMTIIDEADVLMETLEVEAAEDRVSAYIADACGIDDLGEESSGDADSSIMPLMSDEELAMFEELLQTEVGRRAFAEGMTENTDITVEQALCLVDNGDVMGLVMLGLDPDSIDGAVMSTLLATLDECGIPLAAISGQ